MRRNKVENVTGVYIKDLHHHYNAFELYIEHEFIVSNNQTSVTR